MHPFGQTFSAVDDGMAKSKHKHKHKSPSLHDEVLTKHTDRPGGDPSPAALVSQYTKFSTTTIIQTDVSSKLSAWKLH